MTAVASPGNSLLAAALKLAQRGTAVFPCGPDKAPRVGGGFKAATTHYEQIQGWGDLWENGLIGATVPEGQVIIDVDPRNGGTATMAAVVGERLLPSTKRVRTRSGGDHFYFAVPEETVLRPSLGPGVDVKRAGKGYVIVPPSDGYQYMVGGDPAPMPQWLLDELVVEPALLGTDEPSDPKFMPFEQGTAYGLAALERTLGRLVTAEEGGRNHELNKAAFGLAQLVAGGELDEDSAQEALFKAALGIGLEPGESKATILSGWEAGSQAPRQAPVQVYSTTNPDNAPGPVVPRPDDADDPRPFTWVNWDVDEPEPPFYAWPILPENAYVLVYGATEAAKSMSWLGILTDGSKRGLRSSIYSLENPPATDRDRLRRWAPDPACLRLTNESVNFFDRATMEALVEREKAWGTQVIMIDTYSHAFNSHSDDGNAKAIAFARVVRWVMAEVGCSFVVIDHTGFVGDEPRDASAKRQQVDVAILMEKNGDWVHGAPAKFTMTNRKAARFGNPFYLGGEIHDAKGRKLDLRWSGERPEWRL